MLDRTTPLHDDALPPLDADALDPIDPVGGTPFQDPYPDADATDDAPNPFTDDDAHGGDAQDDDLDPEPTTDDPWDDDDGDTAPGLTHWWHGNLG